MERWSETIRIPIVDTLDWDFAARETLCSALVNTAANLVDIPEEYWDTWFGGVSIDGDSFVVVLETE